MSETKEKIINNVKDKLKSTEEIIVNYEQKPMFKTYFIFIVCLFLSFTAGYFLGIRNCVTGSENGNTTITEQLNTAQTSQHELTSGITDATSTSAELTQTIIASTESSRRLEETIRISQEQVNRIAESVDRLEGNVRESGRIIEESESIIQRILRRAKENPTPH